MKERKEIYEKRLIICYEIYPSGQQFSKIPPNSNPDSYILRIYIVRGIFVENFIENIHFSESPDALKWIPLPFPSRPHPPRLKFWILVAPTKQILLPGHCTHACIQLEQKPRNAHFHKERAKEADSNSPNPAY